MLEADACALRDCNAAGHPESRSNKDAMAAVLDVALVAAAVEDAWLKTTGKLARAIRPPCPFPTAAEEEEVPLPVEAPLKPMLRFPWGMGMTWFDPGKKNIC